MGISFLNFFLEHNLIFENFMLTVQGLIILAYHRIWIKKFFSSKWHIYLPTWFCLNWKNKNDTKSAKCSSYQQQKQYYYLNNLIFFFFFFFFKQFNQFLNNLILPDPFWVDQDFFCGFVLWTSRNSCKHQEQSWLLLPSPQSNKIKRYSKIFEEE